MSRAKALTERERGILKALLDQGGQADNKELKQLINTTLTGDSNTKLINFGLVTTERRRTLAHKLTERGKRVAEGEPFEPEQASSGLSSSQVLALVVLMAEARELTNKDFGKLAGFKLNGRENAALERLGYVETDRSSRTFSHQLTDKGWHLMRTLHVTAPPEEGGSAVQSLFTVLANLHRALERLHLSHAEFFKQGSEPTPVRAHAVSGGDDVEASIREAYRELASAPGNWVGLADLRERLADLDRTTVDEALRAMERQDDVRIIPVANSKALSPRDRAAALRIGNEDNHTLAIGQP